MKIDITYRYETRDQSSKSLPADSNAAVRRLCEGNRSFAALFDDAAKETHRAETIVHLDPRDVGLSSAGTKEIPKQQPFAAIIGCADARVPIELIFNQGPNDLFVLRVAGNGLGTEVLGSLRYAIDHLDGLRLIVVLGHSGCGALSTAVDVFLNPSRYLPLATKYTLRSIIDPLLAVVQASARQLLTAFGADLASHPKYRTILIEASIATNAALAAYSIEQELGAIGPEKLRSVYGVYLLETRKVWAPGPNDIEEPRLAPPPRDATKFAEFGEAIVRSQRIRSLLEQAD